METTKIQVAIGDRFNVIYHAILTTAPSDYDGFGTFALMELTGARTVLVRDEHLQWQLARYQSGNHQAEASPLPADAFVETLVRRLMGRSE